MKSSTPINGRTKFDFNTVDSKTSGGVDEILSKIKILLAEQSEPFPPHLKNPEKSASSIPFSF